MTPDWITVAQCAEKLGVPTESVHHLVNCGIVLHTVNREFRTCVNLRQVERALEANATMRLAGLEQLR